MKLFLVHTMLFVGSIWKNKSGSFLFVMSLWLLVAARNRADSWDPSLIFWPKFWWIPTPHDTKEPMKLFLVHTMLFVGSIWKNKSGSFLFVMSLWLLVAGRKLCWQLGSITDFLTQVLLKTNPAWHQRANETLPCPYNAVCCIHMEE
jgi:hypothetical protein